MIRIFDTIDNVFTTNGDKIIQPAKANVYKEDNGDYYVEIEASIDYSDWLIPNKIIVANTPTGSQAFRIGSLEKTRRKITLKAKHISYDANNYLIKDSYVVEKNCNDALDHLNNATDTTSPFTTTSDITKIGSYRCVRTSLFEAWQVVIERWGGHLVRDNFNIGVMNSIGADNGVVVRYGKNLKDIQAKYNWDNVVTKLLPVGKDGLLLPETYVVSDVQYDIPYTKKVSFDQNDINPEDYTIDGVLDEDAYNEALINDLRTKAQAYIDINNKPMVSYTLNANLERITDVGDTIEVIDEQLGINLMTHLLAYKYDCLLEKYTELKFGNFTQQLDNLLSTISEATKSQIDETSDVLRVTLGQELQDATDKILGILGDSFVIMSGKQIMIVDSLPKETATKVMRFNSAGIGFSNTGINGTFNSAWLIDGTLDMQNINVINLVADMIKGGTLKLGYALNQYGKIEVYDESNNLMLEIDKSGFKSYGLDGSYVALNNSTGLTGYDSAGNPIYWTRASEFHMKKAMAEEELSICNMARFVPITITNGNNNIVNRGIALIPIQDWWN